MLWIVGLAAGACAISSMGVDVLAAPEVKTREPVHIMRTDQFGTLPEAGVPVPGLKMFPVPSDKVYVISNATDAIAGSDEKLIYSNPLANKVAEIPGLSLVSDDIKLSVADGCALRRYTAQVIGKANPNACGGQGISCGPVKIDFDLYNECPGAGGTPIDGTHGCLTNAPDTYPGCMVMPSEFDVSQIEIVPTQAVSLFSTMWLGIHASRASTGIIIGTPAQVGFSGDVYDTIDFPCNSSAGGFPSQPHASFNAEIWGAASCPDTCLTYQNIRSSQVGINAGANNCIADDLILPRTCQLAEMEVGLRGAGVYDVELRRNRGGLPDGGCAGGAASMGGTAAISGTHHRFLVTSSGLTVKRFTFSPPIQLPDVNLFAVVVPNNVNANWILTGRNAAIGDTAASYYTWNTDEWASVLPTALHGGMQITLTCAGACPVGACCDQYVRDDDNEAVCRNLPEINCPFPPKGSALKPPWAAGVSCKVCNGGTRDGDACISDADCAIAACDGGTRDGLTCNTGSDCSRCQDGSTPCQNDNDCLGNGDGLCRLADCTAGTCLGNDPFLLPCGQSACCQPDGNCHNVTLNECNLLLPLDASRIWQVGQYCSIEGQRCPEPACIDAEGDCQTPNPRTCNGGPSDGNTCTMDNQCVSTDNGVCVDYPHPICQGGEHNAEECNNDLDCIPGGLCVTSHCDGGARDGQECEGLRDCRESFCQFQPGCNNPFCCTAVCRLAPGPPTDTEFCCEVHWDEYCASLAQSSNLADCSTAPGNDHCAPSRLASGAQEILVDGLEGKTNTTKATVDSNDGFCCNNGIRRCDGGCQDPNGSSLGKPCSNNFDCTGAEDGYCNFPPNFSTGTCTAGCNLQEQCLIPDGNIVRTFCVGGPNDGAPCKPRCVGGTLAGQPCGNVSQCPGGSACDGTIDCGEGNACDNSFCEGTDDGVCADAVPEPGGKGVASVWYYFTVPENGIDDTMNISVSTCGSTSPATDSLLQVFATNDPDVGKCDDNLGKCTDGSYCDRVLQDCADNSQCVATSVACSVAAQDCPIATSTCELNLTGACSKLSAIACSDDAGDVACGQQGRGKLSKVCLPDLERGNTYFILVSAKTTAVLGEYRVRVSSASSCTQVLTGQCINLFCSGGPLDGEPCGSVADCTVPPTPDNDYCPNSIALPVAVGDTVVPFALDGATFDCRDTPCNTNLHNDIWYTWTAPEDQIGTATLSIKTCGAAPPPDTELMIYHGCGCPAPISPQPLCFSAGTDPTCLTSAQTNAPINVEAGDCLTIRLGDNKGFGGHGDMTLTYDYEPPPPCPTGQIFASAPANGAILAAWGLSNCDAAAGLTGVKEFQVFGPPNAANLECWTLCESTSTTQEGTVLPPNNVLSVQETSTGVYTVTLERPITPYACTSILYNEMGGSPSSTTYISLPGDADGSGVTGASDILEVVDAINGTPGPYDMPGGPFYSTDVDFSGVTNGQDILAVVDLLNGAGDCVPWNGVAVPSCGSCPAAP